MHRTTTHSARRSAMLSRLFWLALIAIVVFGVAQLVGYLLSFVDLSRYDELWYLSWM